MADEQAPQAPRLSPRDIAAAIPAVSAVAVGALYALGVVLSVSELLGAHVPVLDVLPLIPLQEHLTRGLGAVFTSVGLFVAAVGLFVGVLNGYAIYRSTRAHFRDFDASVSAARAAYAAVLSDPAFAEPDKLQAEIDEIASELAALKAEAEALGAPGRQDAEHASRAAELARRTAVLTERSAALAALQRRIEETETHLRRADAAQNAITRGIPGVRFLSAHTTVLGRTLGVLLIAMAFFLPPVFAAGFAAAGLWLAAFPRLTYHHPIVWVGITFAICLPIGVDAYVNPAPLPRATIVTDTGVVRGTLITSNGDRYVITSRRDTFQSIPAARVRSATAIKPKRHPPKGLITLVFG